MRLPRTDIEIFYAVDRDALPTSGVVGTGAGSVLNRDYIPEVVTDSSWGLAQQTLDTERETLRHLAAEAGDAVDFENLLFEEPSHFGLDLGIEAACIALCAAGCTTAISCRGHDGEGEWANCPTIIFSAEAARAAIVEEIARVIGCGLLTNEEGNLELWAPSVEETWCLAEMLLLRRAEFDALPDAGAVRAARAAARSEMDDAE